MKLQHRHSISGTTLLDMMGAVTIGSFILAATLIASVALQKSLNAVDNYFATHGQQVRIVDYLARDARRSYIVTATSSPQTVTCVIPNYLIKAGDPDAAVGAGKRRTPTVSKVANTYTVSYGSRTVSDAATTSGSATLTSVTAAFSASDVGKTVIASGVPTNATVATYVNATTITLSQNATATATGVTATFGTASSVVYSINNQSILRTENGTLTTIASSTDNLLPSWLNVTLTNTEYLTTSITFLPIFTSGGASVERTGTTIYSTSYLRNKRRG